MMIRYSFAWRVLAVGLVGWVASVPAWAAAPSKIEFNRDIRPILSNTCFACHGPDASHREADLRLDRFDDATSELDSGTTAIVPGDVAASELVARIVTDDEDLRMPPRESQKTLTPDQIDLLKQWIAQGAPYEGHWSFEPIKRVEPPKSEISNPQSAIKSPIDAFIAHKLAANGLAMSAQADPVTLARRVAFDLTGLPPTPEQVAALVADPSDATYEKLVDELLASPRYGERMAMWWLDLVRYADSVGYHGDQPVTVYPFREWVIRAFNSNQPFDQFTIEQLAGEMLPNATLDQKIAAAYNRLGMTTEEGGAQAKEYLAKYAAERVRNLGGTWLGLTTGCAECHDHKFDPLTTKHFYQLEAFFADIQEKGVYGGRSYQPYQAVPTPEQAAQLAKLDAQLADLNQQLATANPPQLATEQAAWESQLTSATNWQSLKPASVQTASNATAAVAEDASVLLAGAGVDTDKYSLTFTELPANATALRLEALPHDSLPGKGPGRASNGNFVLTELTAKVRAADGDESAVTLANPQASYVQPSFAIAQVIDGKTGNGGWAVHEQMGKPHTAVFELPLNFALPANASLVVELHFDSPHKAHALGHFRFAATTGPRPVQLDPLQKLPPEIRAILTVASTECTAEQAAQLTKYFRTIAPCLANLREEVAATQKQRDQLKAQIPEMLATVTVPPRTIRVLPRGNWMDDSGEEVLPAFPDFLPQPAPQTNRLTRLDLAKWLVSKDHPLTSRVLVNRLWKLLFGNGLSRNLDDLGAQGEWPSHPELLDWLAADLLDHGWDIKRTMKQIVMSSAYRQASLATPEHRQRDPLNRLLARQERFRLDAEMVRDNAVWISGLLVEKIGGASVKPYQPPRYWAYLNFPEREWQNDSGDNLYRRGLYTHWQRQYLHPSLLAFDAPSREECTAIRVRSNTPLQALVLLNDPSYVEAARVFAELIMRNGGATPEAKIDYAVRRALSRNANSAERELLVGLFQQQLQQYRADVAAADKLITVGQRPKASDLDPAELAAWSAVARALLNLHATITRN